MAWRAFRIVPFANSWRVIVSCEPYSYDATGNETSDQIGAPTLAYDPTVAK